MRAAHHVDPKISELMHGGETHPARRNNLTKTEMRVLNLVSGARTNKEIAVSLGVSPATVKRHMENIFTKLQLRNRVETAIYGLLVSQCTPEFHDNCRLAAWHKRVIEDRKTYRRHRATR